MSIQSIIREHAPEVLFDAQLTPAEAEKALANLKQAELYNPVAREAYKEDETQYLKELNAEINHQQSEDLLQILEQDADFNPLEDEAE